MSASREDLLALLDRAVVVGPMQVRINEDHLKTLLHELIVQITEAKDRHDQLCLALIRQTADQFTAAQARKKESKS